MYHQRLATLHDASTIAVLWEAFLKERERQDTSLLLKSQFDYESYVKQKLTSPSIYGFLLEYGDDKQIVGFLFVYYQDETPNLGWEVGLDSPFQSRRLGGAIGLYVQEKHRKPEAITILIEAALSLAEQLKITDIDLQISIEQVGVHRLLERLGFSKTAIQYVKHYEITESDLPSLKQKVSQGIQVKIPQPSLIPLKDPQTQQTVINPKGEQVFLHPITDEEGKVLRSRSGLPIYPTPLRDPQTQEWVFDELGELVVCPVVIDDNGKVKEHRGIPVFKSPIFEQDGRMLVLKRDKNGEFLFEEKIKE